MSRQPMPLVGALLVFVMPTGILAENGAHETNPRFLVSTPVGTAFTYQGRLKNGASPANGDFDLQFALFDDVALGTPVGNAVCKDNVPVVGGLFTVILDFGNVFTGNTLWLEIGVRLDEASGNCETEPFTILSPRQEITPTPYALHALDGVLGCVLTMSDLKALSLPAPGHLSCVRVLGYHAPGDDGGGQFFWDSTTNDSDNGGTVIAPASNPPVGRWRRSLATPLSVRWFGAIGDGTADDREAVRRALNSGAAHIIIPPGTYRLDPDLQYPSADLLDVPTTVKLIQGPGTLRQGGAPVPNGGEPNILSISNSTGLTIRDVAFVGNQGTTSVSNNNGIVAVSCSNLTIENCTFTGLVNQAIYVTGTPTSFSEHIKIVNNTCVAMGSGFNLTKCRFATIRGNFIGASNMITNDTVGIGLTSTIVIDIDHDDPASNPDPAAVCKDIVISDNIIDGYRRIQSILIHAGENVLVTGNQILDARLGITANPYSQVTTDVVRNIIIANNLVVGTDNPQLASPGSSCIGVGGAPYSQIPSGVLIADNTVVGCNKERGHFEGGISIGYSDRVTLRGNQVLDCYVSGIVINNTSARLIVDGNTIENTQWPSDPALPPNAIWVRTGAEPPLSGRIENNVINGGDQPASGGIRLDCPEGSPGCSMAYPKLVIGSNSLVNVVDPYVFQNNAIFDVPINGSGTRCFSGTECTGLPGTSCMDVVFYPEPEPNDQYSITLTGNMAETFWITNKSASGFTVRSSNPGSIACVDWHLIR